MKNLISFEWVGTENLTEQQQLDLNQSALSQIIEMLGEGFKEGELSESLFDPDNEDFKGVLYCGNWKIETEIVKDIPTKSKEKQEIIRKIESLLNAHGSSITYPDLAGEIHMDCQQRLKGDKWTTHLIYEYLPTYATVEVYRNDSSDDADDMYDWKYSKMKLPLLKEILANLEQYVAIMAQSE